MNDSKTTNKINLLVLSDFCSPTGFSRVSESIMQYLPPDDYNIIVIAVNYSGDPHEFPYKIYPAGTYNDLYGINRIEEILMTYKIDIIFILNDAWVQSAYLAKIKQLFEGAKDRVMPKIVTYTPVDAKDHQADWYKHFDIVTKPVAYTYFGFREMVAAREDLVEKLDVIQHGVDTNVFYTLDYNAREKVFPNRPVVDDPDAFIVLNSNRNQPRKRLELTIKGFSIFATDKPANVKLYLHSGIVDAKHMNTAVIAQRSGVMERLILTTTKPGIPGVSTHILNEIYNSCNVGINTGLGEGWGLPNMEHACTGAVQVVPSHSACRELYSDCGVLIPTSTEYVLDEIMTTGYLVDPNDVANSLEYLYQNRDIMKTLAEKGKAKFTAEEFSWRYISSKWDRLFKNCL